MDGFVGYWRYTICADRVIGCFPIHRLIGQLLYGCGMRIKECLRLRVKDIQFEQGWIEMHRSKGDKSRFVPLPKHVGEELKRLLDHRDKFHKKDVERGTASVWLPHALAKKYPHAHQQLKWQFVFASTRRVINCLIENLWRSIPAQHKDIGADDCIVGIDSIDFDEHDGVALDRVDAVLQRRQQPSRE